MKRINWIFIFLFLLLTGCSAANSPTNAGTSTTDTVPALSTGIIPLPSPTQVPATTLSSPPTTVITAPATTSPSLTTAQIPIPEHVTTNVRLDDPNVYNFSSLIPFDGIRPVYNPVFSEAEGAALAEDELVMGVAWGGEAKAYSVTVLRHREMVNDELAGIPILVTW